MATLTHLGFSLSVEISYIRKDNEIGYRFGLMHGDEPMLNYKIYRGMPANTPKRQRPRGSTAWCIEEDLVPTLEWALKHNDAASWSPIEPDISFSVYPDDQFPLRAARPKYVEVEDDEFPFDRSKETERTPKERKAWFSDEYLSEEKAYQDRKAKLGGKHPDDSVCVIVRIDASTFGKEGYCSSGPALILNPTRREFTRFVKDLKAESRDAVKEHKQWARKKMTRQQATK